jgi:TolB-like protein/archaellum biogenesis ATPase FlaH/Flp pilus assembly protein TadD
VASSGVPELDNALGPGFPDRSVILVSGPTGSGKEILLYDFLQSSLGEQGNFCLYISTLSVDELCQDFWAHGIDLSRNASPPFWYTKGEGGDLKLENDLVKLSFEIKEILAKNAKRKIRIVIDALSSLLMSFSPEAVYKFLDQLLLEVKKYNSVLVATLEDGMHQPQVKAAIEQLFDGVLEFQTDLQDGGEVCFKVKKMRGVRIVNSTIRMPSTSTQEINTAKQVLSPKVVRVAVLPFSNISPEGNDEYFADGITDEIISTLSNISGLRVISRTSMLGFAKTTKRIQLIAKELGVSCLVEGTVRKWGNEVRISVQLIDGASEEPLWTSRYDRKLDDIFSVQADVARQVAESLSVKLSIKEQTRLDKRGTRNITAYTLYLQGRKLLAEFSAVAFRQALEKFELAVKEDSNFASAFAGIGMCCVAMGGWGLSETQESYRRGKEAITTALRLDDSNSEAHAALGRLLYYYDYDYARSELEFRKAIELNPSYAFAHYGYAVCLIMLERMEEALMELDVSQELDPLSSLSLATKAVVLMHVEREEEAFNLMKKGLELYSSSSLLNAMIGMYYASKAATDEAVLHFKASLELDPNNSIALAGLGYTNAISGRRQDAQAIIERLKIMGKKVSTSGFIATVFAGLNERDRFFESMSKAIEERGMNAFFYVVNPLTHSMKSDERYAVMLSKLRISYRATN